MWNTGFLISPGFYNPKIKVVKTNYDTIGYIAKKGGKSTGKIAYKEKVS